MDFAFTDEQTMVRDLAQGILEKEVDADRVKAVESGPSWFDRTLWATLAETGLLGIAIGEEQGGMGLGFLELCALLEQSGRVVAPVPLVPALVLGGLAVAKFGSEEQRRRWLPGLAAGETIITGAFAESAGCGAVTAKRDGQSWMLSGKRGLIPAADSAACILVPARLEGRFAIFAVDPNAEGAVLTRSVNSRREPLFALTLANLRVDAADLLGGALLADAEQITWVEQRAVVANAAVQVGVSARALELTADYVRERVQFGVPIGSFQAVQHRLADAYIDVEAMRWAMWRAAWKLAAGLDAAREVAVAKLWAAEAGARVAASAQHLHGGIGVDVDYPIHRYFLWSKALELDFGSGAAVLATLGRHMAAHPPGLEVSK